MAAHDLVNVLYKWDYVHFESLRLR